MSTPPPARVVVDLDDGQARFVSLAASTYLMPRPLACDGPTARVALVGTYAMLLAGDDLRIEVVVDRGVSLEVVEPSGTVAYDARGGSARWSADVSVASGGRLVWDGAPFVVAHGADVARHTHVDLAGDAAMLLRETLVLGRTGEPTGGLLATTLRVSHDDHPLLVEDLDLRSPEQRTAPGILGGHRVLGTLALLGRWPAQTHGPYETELAGPGALARVVTSEAHIADDLLGETWQRWYDCLAGPGASKVA